MLGQAKDIKTRRTVTTTQAKELGREQGGIREKASLESNNLNPC
jgi:hypothetical protein